LAGNIIMKTLLKKIAASYENSDAADKLRQIFIDEFIKNKDKFCSVIYVDIPYCRQKCAYCVYTGKVNPSDDELDDYVSKVIPYKTALYKEIFEKCSFDMIYFGGGTPDILSRAQLEKIFSAVPSFENIKYKMTEAHPALLTDEHIDLYKKYNFCYLSLGIQSLDTDVLKKNNRLLFGRDDLKVLSKKLDGIFYNTDIIAFLDSAGMPDLEITKKDLEYLCSNIKAPSVTVHHNAGAEKNINTVRGMVNLVSDICSKYNYVCVNSNLNDVDIKAAISKFKNNLWELKIIRKGLSEKYVPDYLLSEFNNDDVFGFNMLGLGGNEHHPILSTVSNIRYYETENTIIAKPLDKISFTDFVYFLHILSKNNIMLPVKG